MMECLKKLFKLKKAANTDSRFVWYNTVPFSPELNELNINKTNLVKTSRYNLWTFVPVNLFEQFQKLANFYFLVLVIVLFSLGSKAPISPTTTILPLAFVVVLTAVKQGYEDFQRHKSDREVNNRIIHKLQNQEFQDIFASEIKLGNIIRVNNGEEFPCDMILLSSSNKEGKCFITTANFDGETNLKTRFCAVDQLELKEPAQLSTLSCTLEMEAPNYDLYRFTGKISINSVDNCAKEQSLGPQNYLLRGAQLKNTEYVYGITIFIGDETKLAMNLQAKRRKVSIVDKKLNKFIFVFIAILVVGSVIATALHFTFGRQFSAWYLNDSFNDVSTLTVFVDIFTFVSLLNYLIPISLYVTIELQKFINSGFIDWDLDMYHAPSDNPAHSNTSDIVEELGQIEYVFSDKTGTLTENCMIFQKCIVGTKLFAKSGVHLEGENGEVILLENMNEELLRFFIYMCVCHTAEAQVCTPTDEYSLSYKYQASSPDEVSLLEAAATLGIVFQGKESNHIVISVGEKVLRFQILHVLEFDSTRKRMSIIVLDQQGQYLMIVKGAESHVLPLCNNSAIRESIQSAIDIYAQTGLRTLAFAYKIFTPEEYQNVHTILNTAELDVVERELKLVIAYEATEIDFIAIGATAVEDKLQEEVHDTLVSLRAAGIKLWVLTGDKEETAVSISFTCGHLTHDMDILYLCQRSDNIAALLEDYKNRFINHPTHNFALVMDGQTLKSIIHVYKDELLEIFKRTDTVLCCRMSPLQKSQIVHFMRTNISMPVTLAIGDGANDCSMIQEAHVGIGIMGNEGRQAVYSSDYSIHRFKYLKKLLLFHGYNFYVRITTSIQYFFYKNALLVSSMYIYIFFTKFSPSSLFSDPQLTMFNTLITALPILGYGIFEQHFSKSILLSNSKLYKSIANNTLMSWMRLLLWSLNGVWQSFVVFGFCFLIYNNGFVNVPYQYMTLDTFGTMIYTYLIICATLQIGFITRFWTIYTFILIIGSLIFYVICASFVAMLYSFGPNDTLFSNNFDSYYVFFIMMQFPQFWIGLVFIIPLAFSPYFLAVFIDQRIMENTFSISPGVAYNNEQGVTIPKIFSSVKSSTIV